MGVIKRATDSYNDFEVIWYDSEEKDLLIKEIMVIFKLVEFRPPDPLLPMLHATEWSSRCSHQVLKFNLDENIICTQIHSTHRVYFKTLMYGQIK